MAFEKQRGFARRRKGKNLQPRGRSVGQRRHEPLAGRNGLTGHVFGLERIEDRIGPEDRKHAIMGVERKGRAFAQRQEPGDCVDFAIGEDHARYGRMALQARLGPQRRGIGNLLAQIGRGVDQKPVLAVGTDGDRSLVAADIELARARITAVVAAAIPLRHAAACRGTEYEDFSHSGKPRQAKSTTCALRRRTC